MAELVHGPLDEAPARAGIGGTSDGAIVVFLGTTRDRHEGRTVLRLAYEAYEPMARARLAALEAEALTRFAVSACRVTHRLGEVPAGEASVLVAVAAEHRGAAFDACRWLMDEVKQRVPIWKREQYADGGASWVEGRPLR